MWIFTLSPTSACDEDNETLDLGYSISPSAYLFDSYLVFLSHPYRRWRSTGSRPVTVAHFIHSKTNYNKATVLIKQEGSIHAFGYPASNVTIKLYYGSDPPSFLTSTTTAFDGTCSFLDLDIGNYNVEILLDASYAGYTILEYEMVSTEDLKQAYSASEPYILLKDLENVLRGIIESELSKISEDWWK